MSTPAGSYKNYDFLSLSTGEVDSLDQFTPQPAPNYLSRVLDRVTNNVQKVSVVIPASSVRILNATAVTILAAPGAGKAIIPIHLMAKMTYNANAYNAVGTGDDLTLKYTNTSGSILMQVETTGFLDQTTDQIRVAFPNTGSVARLEITPVANAAIVAHVLSGELASSNVDASGDSPLRLDFYYTVLPV